MLRNRAPPPVSNNSRTTDDATSSFDRKFSQLTCSGNSITIIIAMSRTKIKATKRIYFHVRHQTKPARPRNNNCTAQQRGKENNHSPYSLPHFISLFHKHKLNPNFDILKTKSPLFTTYLHNNFSFNKYLQSTGYKNKTYEAGSNPNLCKHFFYKFCFTFCLEPP